MSKFRGKTAYGLLSYIAKTILESPASYDQHSWAHKVGNSGYTSADVLECRLEEEVPCGTVGCVAGHTLLHTGHNPLRITKWDAHENIPQKAARILGLNSEQAEELFEESAAGRRFEVRPSFGGNVATLRSFLFHAERGASHIRRFMAAHSKQLRAKKVVVHGAR